MWDAESDKPADVSLPHGDKVTSAAFSPDGRRVVTASSDHTAREWDVLFTGPGGEDAEILALAAEFTSGHSVNEFGSIVPVDNPQERLHDIWEQLNRNPRDDPDTILWFLRRFLPKKPEASK